jgi:V-type H+-transporting ATPase subunit d
MSDMIFFNVEDGYAEALLRGLRKGFLTETTYNIIRNTNSLKDLKTVKKLIYLLSYFIFYRF